jgi:hypothetical protein
MNDIPQEMSRLVVRQNHTMMVNRYTIHPVDDAGNEAPAIAAAQQKRLALNEQVTFYADEQRKRPIFRFKARDTLELGTTASGLARTLPVGAAPRPIAAVDPGCDGRGS